MRFITVPILTPRGYPTYAVIDTSQTPNKYTGSRRITCTRGCQRFAEGKAKELNERVKQQIDPFAGGNQVCISD